MCSRRAVCLYQLGELRNRVAGIALADPDRSLRDIASQLERMRERTPRGGRQWAASSVKSLLDQVRDFRLVVPQTRDDA